MGAKNWNLADVTVTVGGFDITGIITDGDAVSVSYAGESTMLKTGMDLQSTRSTLINSTGTCTLSIVQGHQSNDVLQALKDAGGVFDFRVKDLNGPGGCYSPDAAFVKIPDWTANQEAGQIDWELSLDMLEIIHGRNYAPDERG